MMAQALDGVAKKCGKTGYDLHPANQYRYL